MTTQRTITRLPKAANQAGKKTSFSLEDALLSLSSIKEAEAFLLDLCTPAEIAAFRERWDIAQLLDQRLPYRDVAEKTGASTATVTRVARFLQHERHRGYRHVLDKLLGKKP